MPGLVKIGIATDVHQRMGQLYSTGVPLPFQCEYAAEVADAARVEKALHQAFGANRVSDRREFFEVEPFRAIGIIELLAIREVTPGIKKPDITPEEARAVAERTERREHFSFSLVGLAIGTQLHFREKPDVIAEVASNKKILFQGNIVSLSASAKEIMLADGYEWAERSIAGPNYWMYEGESLHERRVRMEDED